MHKLLAVVLLTTLPYATVASELSRSIAKDYEDNLEQLFDHFHRNPELPTIEHDPAARMAAELRALGYEVTEGVGGTGVVAMFKNGNGPLVMMRAAVSCSMVESSGLR